MKKIMIICLTAFVVLFMGCTSNAAYFVKKSMDDDYIEILALSNIPAQAQLAEGEEPIVYRVSDIDAELKELRTGTKGTYYRYIGRLSRLIYYDWASYEEMQKLSVTLAKKKKAKLAVYSITSTKTRTETEIKTETSYDSKTDSYTTTSTPVTYTVEGGYEHDIYLFAPYTEAEIAKWHLGLGGRDLNTKEREKSGRNTGFFLQEIRMNYPGFYANMQYGDIIISMNGTAINNAADFADFESKLKEGDNVRITFVRDGKTQSVDMVSK